MSNDKLEFITNIVLEIQKEYEEGVYADNDPEHRICYFEGLKRALEIIRDEVKNKKMISGNLSISEFKGTITIRYGNYKVSAETLSECLQRCIDNCMLYPEKLGNDRLESLVLE